ncbi:MAG: winged helix-turn-helix transcriptional regulator [Elusimicrobiota bacterium]
MTSDNLAEKEFILIQEISKSDTHTQRSLSQNIGLSLGTTNLLIQRLARKGLIKITQLDWKRTQYLLTLKGALEKTNKMYRHTLYTIRLFRQIQDNINTVMRREYENGRRDFHLVAHDEILDLLKETVGGLNLPQARFAYYKNYDSIPAEAELIMTATLAPPPKDRAGHCLSLVDFNNIDFRAS